MYSQEMADFYKTIIETQNSNYQILFAVLIGFTTLLLAVTFIWNLYYSNKKIKEEIEKEITGLEIKYCEKEAKITLIIKEDLTKHFENEIDDIKANLFRITAYSLQVNKQYNESIYYYSISLQHHLKLETYGPVRNILQNILLILNHESFIETTIDKNLVIEIIKKVPDTLNEEKYKIISKIGKLKQNN